MDTGKLQWQRKVGKKQHFLRDVFQNNAMGIPILGIIKIVLFSGDILLMPIWNYVLYWFSWVKSAVGERKSHQIVIRVQPHNLQ